MSPGVNHEVVVLNIPAPVVPLNQPNPETTRFKTARISFSIFCILAGLTTTAVSVSALTDLCYPNYTSKICLVRAVALPLLFLAICFCSAGIIFSRPRNH